MTSPNREPVSSRGSLTGALLFSAVAIAGLLAWQAYASARSHRAAAEKALRDYAMLASEEFARRTVARLGYSGYYALVTDLRNAGSLPDPATLRASADESTRAASDLVRLTFRYAPRTRILETRGPAPDSQTQAWITAALEKATAAAPAPRPYFTVHAVVSGIPRTLVYGTAGTEPAPVFVGFEVDTGALAARFRAALAEGPLLPASLSKDRVGNDALFLRVLDPAGREAFRAGTPWTPYLGVERPFGGDYHGILEGSVAFAAIDPAASSSLVIGGLPRSRLGFLALLMTLTAGLILAAALLLRRERALARMRSEFVSRVSHELRTPLTQIRMFAETLLFDRVRSEEERARALSIIDRESRRLTNLVENVLRFSRGERGEDRVAPSTQDVGLLVAEILRDFEPLLDGEARIETRVIPAALHASIDPGALRQILLNMLDNAVKYGPRGQTIRVEATNGHGRVAIAVEDQGPGIPSRERERIWDRFYRLERDRESPVAGTGIGLAVVRDLAALQGGRAWVEPGRDGGSRFVIELPVGNTSDG